LRTHEEEEIWYGRSTEKSASDKSPVGRPKTDSSGSVAGKAEEQKKKQPKGCCIIS